MELELPAREPSLTRENARRGSFGQRGRLSVRLSPFQRLLLVKGKDRSGSIGSGQLAPDVRSQRRHFRHRAKSGHRRLECGSPDTSYSTLRDVASDCLRDTGLKIEPLLH